MMEYDHQYKLDPTMPLKYPCTRYNIHLATLVIINLYTVMMSQSGDITRIASRAVSVRSTAWTFEAPSKYERTEGGFCPYTSSKGVMRVAVWYEVLYHHLARGNH
jgi:hypothetical protein